MSDFSGSGFISSLIGNFEEGLKTEDFEKVIIGSTDYDRLSYPCVQVYPDVSDYNGDHEYQDSHLIFFIFESGKNSSKIVENSEKVEKALDSLADEISKNEIVKEFKPQRFQFRVGENSDNLLDIIEVQYGVTKFEGFQ